METAEKSAPTTQGKTDGLAVVGRLPRALVVVLGLVVCSASEGRASGAFDTNDVATLFFIRKTENRNRVDYGLRVDATCLVSGDEPVLPYWRMLERGAGVTQPLRRFEHRAYGIASQRVDASRARVVVQLRALGDRAITVTVRSTPSGCAASATVPMRGTASAIEDILVVQSGPRTVDHIELRGRAVRDGSRVEERIDP